MWNDFQEIFYIVIGPFVVDLLLPIFIAAGVLLAVLMATSRLWQRGGGGRSSERR